MDGVRVLESEIVGLVPAEALPPDPRKRLKLQGGGSGSRPGKHAWRRHTTQSRPKPGYSHPSLRVSSSLSRCRPRRCPARRGAMPNARIFLYRLLRSTPSTSAVREMLPC